MNTTPTPQRDHLDAIRGIATGALLGIPCWLALLQALHYLRALTQGLTP